MSCKVTVERFVNMRAMRQSLDALRAMDNEKYAGSVWSETVRGGRPLPKVKRRFSVPARSLSEVIDLMMVKYYHAIREGIAHQRRLLADFPAHEDPYNYGWLRYLESSLDLVEYDLVEQTKFREGETIQDLTVRYLVLRREQAAVWGTKARKRAVAASSYDNEIEAFLRIYDRGLRSRVEVPSDVTLEMMDGWRDAQAVEQ